MLAVLALPLSLAACGGQTAAPSAAVKAGPIVEFGAGTLAVPFQQINSAFTAAHPGMTFQPRFGGSVKMIKQITDLHQQADVLAVADYSVIPQYMSGQWYAGFAGNAITFVYTAKSKGASDITADNWYKVLAEPGVQIGRSNPDTDPSGYQTLQMLRLAESYYHSPGLYDAILKNAPQTNMRDTETELLAALDAGQIDYLAIYRSDAKQHNLKYLQLPPQIDLSDAKYTADYAKAVASTKNGDISGKPIVYAVTIPPKAPQPALAEQFVSFLLGKDGQDLMAKNGFVSVAPAYGSDVQAAPAGLRPLLQPWPK